MQVIHRRSYTVGETGETALSPTRKKIELTILIMFILIIKSNSAYIILWQNNRNNRYRINLLHENGGFIRAFWLVTKCESLKWIRQLERYLQMNYLFSWSQILTPKHACLGVKTRVFIAWLTDWVLFACVKRLGLAFKFGFKFPVGGQSRTHVRSQVRFANGHALQLNSFQRQWCEFFFSTKFAKRFHIET